MTNEGARPSIEELSKDQFLIKDVETLKAVADPLRVRLFMEMRDGPHTVKEVAASLAVPPTRLYYHVKILEKHGLLRVVGTRMVSGIEERSYQATAHGWTIDPSLLLAGVLVESGVVKAMLDVVAAELAIALRATEGKPIGDPSSAVPVLTFTGWHLSPDEVLDVQRRFIELMEAFSANKPGEGKQEYHGLLALYRPHGEA